MVFSIQVNHRQRTDRQTDGQKTQSKTKVNCNLTLTVTDRQTDRQTDITTRGQAVARIADRTASQQTLLISDCC